LQINFGNTPAFLWIIKNKYQIMKSKKYLILNDFSQLLRLHLSDNLKDLVLFGSRINGKAKKDSDYDFLVILKQKADWRTEREISDLSYEIELKYNIVTDTHVLVESELSTLRGKQPIYVNAIEKGIHA
jgi:predicted nucleotidyltransferase